MRMKDVPTKAEKALKTKNAARFGAKAVPRLSAVNRTAVIRVILGEVDQPQRYHVLLPFLTLLPHLSHVPDEQWQI
jgi:hypothetical protein